MTYDLQTVKAPRVAGMALSAAVTLVENPLTRGMLLAKLLVDAGVIGFRGRTFSEAPSVRPVQPGVAAHDADPALGKVEIPAPSTPFESARDFIEAYRAKRLTPEVAVERVLAAVEKSNAHSPALRAVIATNRDDAMAQAKFSTERWAKGVTHGPLDGVPVFVKDELDVAGYHTTVGTRFLGTQLSQTDSTVVTRLKAAGAIICGKTNMHEIGIDTTGFNAHHGTVRNPYDLQRYPGGSSSGSASAVAAGLCPIAVGADGGGSIRIPAALCGVTGLKATFGRISEAGAFPLCWSVGHVGPIGATVDDVALAYDIMAGPDVRDASSLLQPTPSHGPIGGLSWKGLKIGVFRPWFEHAEPGVVSVCDAFIEKALAAGAVKVDIEVPDLESCRIAHAVTILSEMWTSMERYDGTHRSELSLGVRMNLALARALSNTDYVRAQQVRTRMVDHLNRSFSKVDLIITPTTARTAPPIRPDALSKGESDLDVTSACMRFVFLTNLTGHPSLSMPAGHAPDGLPVGIQFIGRPWSERMMLGLARAAEHWVERKPPVFHNRLLG